MNLGKLNKLVKRYNINSAIMFYAFSLLYSVFIGVETNLKNIFTILCFTLLFWLANSLQASKVK